MEKKIIFFDVDGTLVDVRPSREYIPESTVAAIRETRKKGNYCFLCTGRSLAEIYPHILEVGFDGIIGAGGGFAMIGNEMLFHKKVSDQSVTNVVDFFEEHKYDYYLESNGGLFASTNLIERLETISYGDLQNDPEARRRKEEHPSHFIESMKSGHDMYRSDVNKICFLENTDVPFAKIVDQFAHDFNVIHCTVPKFGDDSGELSVVGVSKSSAIESVISHLGLKQENTFAYGDGLNDTDMLEYCRHGIAVGNAKEKLKEIADEVCDDIAQDGIAKSMREHNLI